MGVGGTITGRWRKFPAPRLSITRNTRLPLGLSSLSAKTRSVRTSASKSAPVRKPPLNTRPPPSQNPVLARRKRPLPRPRNSRSGPFLRSARSARPTSGRRACRRRGPGRSRGRCPCRRNQYRELRWTGRSAGREVRRRAATAQAAGRQRSAGKTGVATGCVRDAALAWCSSASVAALVAGCPDGRATKNSAAESGSSAVAARPHQHCAGARGYRLVDGPEEASAMPWRRERKKPPLAGAAS